MESSTLIGAWPRSLGQHLKVFLVDGWRHGRMADWHLRRATERCKSDSGEGEKPNLSSRLIQRMDLARVSNVTESKDWIVFATQAASGKQFGGSRYYWIVDAEGEWS